MNDYLDHLITDFFSPLLTTAKYLILFIFHLHGRLSWPLDDFFFSPSSPSSKMFLTLHIPPSWMPFLTTKGHINKAIRTHSEPGTPRHLTYWVPPSAVPNRRANGDGVERMARKAYTGRLTFTPARLKIIRRLKCWDDKKKSVQVVTLLLYTNIRIAQGLNTSPVKQSHYI